MHIAIATCQTLPEPDPDAPLLAAALQHAGIDARLLAWDDPAAPFSAAKLTLLRSTWNYIHHRDAFLGWADALGNKLVNPPAVVHWNSHKRYLRELEASGFATVPTVLVPRASGAGLSAIMRKKQWFRAVAKPAVGAGSFSTKVVNASEQDDAWFAAALAERDMLVQPFMPEVEASGERALVFIEGNVTHAVRKSPRFSDHAEAVTPVDIAPDERALAERVMHWVMRALPCGGLLYGRIDLVRSHTGEPVLMELELIEPSLFWSGQPDALERFVGGVRARL